MDTPTPITLPPLLLTMPQAAKALAVSVRTLYHLAADGQIRIVHIGRAARVKAEDVQTYVDLLGRTGGAA